jgi:hypothetical protein
VMKQRWSSANHSGPSRPMGICWEAYNAITDVKAKSRAVII